MVWEQTVLGVNGPWGEWYVGELSWKGTVLRANGMWVNSPGGKPLGGGGANRPG